MAYAALLSGTTDTTTLDRIGEIFSFLGERVTDVIGIITTPGNEIMLIGLGIFVFGAAIGLGGRLIGR